MKKKNVLREAFGSMPNLGIDAQKMKDELREESFRREEKLLRQLDK